MHQGSRYIDHGAGESGGQPPPEAKVGYVICFKTENKMYRMAYLQKYLNHTAF